MRADQPRPDRGLWAGAVAAGFTVGFLLGWLVCGAVG